MPHVRDVLPPLLKEPFPGLRELHALVAPMEEDGAQLLLQQGDLPGDGGLGHMELAGGGGYAPLLHHGAEVFQLANGHTETSIPKKYCKNTDEIFFIIPYPRYNTR